MMRREERAGKVGNDPSLSKIVLIYSEMRAKLIEQPAKPIELEYGRSLFNGRVGQSDIQAKPV